MESTEVESAYRPLSRGGHFVSGDLKKLCLCMASLVLSKRLAVQKQSFSFESLAGHDVSERSTQAEAHSERNFNCQTHIASLFKLRIFVDIIIKARVASLKVTEFFLPSLFVQIKQTRKAVVLARWLFAFC